MERKPKGHDDAFLFEWLSDYEASKRDFELSLADLNAAQLEELAVTNEFRTWRLHRASIDHRGLVLKRFVSEGAFKQLWQSLSEYDRKHETFAFTPANGGVPATLLRHLDDWYRTPKFTRTQLNNHYKKIARGCDDLLHLLRQVTPGAIGANRFDSFNNLDPNQALYLLRCFQSPAELGKRKLRSGTDDAYYTKLFVQEVLKQAEVTPIAALECIKGAACGKAYEIKLPTKLGAKGAMRTYFINATFGAINNANSVIFHSGSIASNQLLADLVCLIADTDCNADDVRKALKKSPED